MHKRIKSIIFAVTACAVAALSASMSGCTIKTKHPRAQITIEFNEVTYKIEYTLYRNMYPATVQHFIELADAGYYNNMIIHDYKSNDWFTGAYSYDSTTYADSYSDSSMSAYLETNSKEQAYYNLFTEGKFSATVYSQLSYNGDKQTVDKANALPTLIGEFSANDHNIDKGALTAKFGVLKMYYYSKGDTNQKVAIKNSFNEIMEHDYKYNCATSTFGIQVGDSSSYGTTSYCVFGQLRNDSASDTLEDLKDAISDYITDNLDGTTSKFSTSVSTYVDNLDTFASETGRSIQTNFTMTTVPLIVKSVKITKY
jgi:cyclophilin family peptidyl-prolyl cis-trans isomerase